MTYVCYDDGEDGGDCEYDEVDAYASVNVPFPPPQITSLSTYSVNQGDQGTLTVTGTNLVQNTGDQLTINLSRNGGPFTPIGTPTSTTATFSYDFTWYPVGSYTLTVANNEGESDGKAFTVNSATPNVVPPPDPCDVTSNPQVGFTSIVPTGSAGGSGTVAVSFSGSAFTAISPNVTYGPSSTPESIAASMAALITKNYFQYGLSAKAFGATVVYNGNTTIGTVSNVIQGPSVTTDSSSTAAKSTKAVCKGAPLAPAPPTEVTIVGWIDKKAITLPQGESATLDVVFPPSGAGLLALPGCLAELGILATGHLGVVPNTANDKAYASAWLLKYSANSDPGPVINPSTFKSSLSSFRLFNDYAPSLNGVNPTLLSPGAICHPVS